MNTLENPNIMYLDNVSTASLCGGNVLEGILTYRRNKVLVAFQCLCVASILDVPNSDGFVIGHADDEFSTGMKDKPSNPVIMTNLQKARH